MLLKKNQDYTNLKCGVFFFEIYQQVPYSQKAPFSQFYKELLILQNVGLKNAAPLTPLEQENSFVKDLKLETLPIIQECKKDVRSA